MKIYEDITRRVLEKKAATLPFFLTVNPYCVLSWSYLTFVSYFYQNKGGFEPNNSQIAPSWSVLILLLSNGLVSTSLCSSS